LIFRKPENSGNETQETKRVHINRLNNKSGACWLYIKCQPL